MSKKLRILMAVMALGLALIVLSACNGLGQLTPMELMQRKYENIDAAKTIEQHIAIMRGEMLQFESEKTFEKTGVGFRDSVFAVTGTEKRLNGIDADEPYTESAIEPYEVKATTGVPTLKLDEKYFEEGYEVSETKLAGTVKQEHIKDVFGLSSEELSAPTEDLVIELGVTASRLTTVKITYKTSNGSDVTITLDLVY